MKSHKIKYTTLIKAAISLLMLLALTHFVDLQEILVRIQRADPGLVALATIGLLAGYCLCGLRWAWLAEGLGVAVVRWRKYQLLFLGLFASLFLPSTIGGDVVRAVLISQGRKGQRWHAVGSVFFDRLNGLYSLTLLLCVCTLFVELRTDLKLLIIALATLPWIAWLLYPLLHHRLPERLGFWRALPLTEPEFRHAWWRSMVLSLLFQSLVVEVHLLLGLAVGLEMSWAEYAVMVALVGLASVLPITFNGFGIREAGYVGLAILFGADGDAAAAMAGLWAILLVVAALPGGIVLIRLGGRKALREPS